MYSNDHCHVKVRLAVLLGDIASGSPGTLQKWQSSGHLAIVAVFMGYSQEWQSSLGYCRRMLHILIDNHDVAFLLLKLHLTVDHRSNHNLALNTLNSVVCRDMFLDQRYGLDV